MAPSSQLRLVHARDSPPAAQYAACLSLAIASSQCIRLVLFSLHDRARPSGDNCIAKSRMSCTLIHSYEMESFQWIAMILLMLEPLSGHHTVNVTLSNELILGMAFE